MEGLFNNLKNKQQLEKVFVPVLQDLQAVNLLTRSDEISFRLLLERIDEYFLKLKERAEYFKKVKPELLAFDKQIVELQISDYQQQLESGTAKNETYTRIKLLQLQKQLCAINTCTKFETFTLKQNGEIEISPVFDFSQITKDIMNLLKENTLTNTARTRMVHTFKLGSTQKSLTQILEEMVSDSSVS